MLHLLRLWPKSEEPPYTAFPYPYEGLMQQNTAVPVYGYDGTLMASEAASDAYPVVQRASGACMIHLRTMSIEMGRGDLLAKVTKSIWGI